MLFSMMKLAKFRPPYGGVFTFYYTKHFFNSSFRARLSCTADARPLTGFEEGPNLAENSVLYVLLTT